MNSLIYLFGMSGLEWHRRVEVKPFDRLLLDSFIEQIECFEMLIGNVDAEIGRRASIGEGVRLLLSLTGVGVYSALPIKSEVGDIRRFPSYKRSWLLGLVWLLSFTTLDALSITAILLSRVLRF